MAEDLVWSQTGISHCPRCGRRVAVGIMSLSATCVCGMYYADINEGRGWYWCREAYERGDRRIEPGELPPPKKDPNCTLDHDGPCNPCCNPWEY